MFVHDTATIEDGAQIGENSKIWGNCQVRRNAVIGHNCVLGRGVFVDADVQIGNAVKIQNYVSIFTGVTLEDGVFVGPHVCFTNDLYPRAVNPDMSLKGASDWVITPTFVKRGASLGANATIVCGTTIGEWAMIGAGSVVHEDVPAYSLMVGVPARQIGYVCKCGNRQPSLEHAKICNCKMTHSQAKATSGA